MKLCGEFVTPKISVVTDAFQETEIYFLLPKYDTNSDDSEQTHTNTQRPVDLSPYHHLFWRCWMHGTQSLKYLYKYAAKLLFHANKTKHKLLGTGRQRCGACHSAVEIRMWYWRTHTHYRPRLQPRCWRKLPHGHKREMFIAGCVKFIEGLTQPANSSYFVIETSFPGTWESQKKVSLKTQSYVHTKKV